jgi:hypothetical protein
MNSWSVELFIDQIDKNIIIDKFVKFFPQRSRSFFDKIVSSLELDNSKLFVLIRDGELVGASFSFKLSGYEFDMWSPSYLYVEEKHRDISLLFLISVLKKMGPNVIDISPTPEVQKILKAIKYKEVSKGSLAFPLFQGFLQVLLGRFFKRSFSPLKRFSQRRDILWFKDASSERIFAVKRSSRYGIPIFILVYSNKDDMEKYVNHLIGSLFLLNPMGLFVMPNFGMVSGKLFVRLDKFHSFSNVQNLGLFYSMLGSEVTEVI